MSASKYMISWKTFAGPAIGLIAFFVYVYLFNVNIFEIVSTASQINFGFYLIAAIATLVDTFFFTLTWHLLLDYLHVKISLLRKFVFVWIGIFVDTIVPAESVSGEVAKIYLVNREQSGTAGKATASVVVQRLINMIVNVAALVVGAILLLLSNHLSGTVFWLVLFLVPVTLFFVILILLLCAKEDWTVRIVGVLINFVERISRGKWKLSKIRGGVVEAARTFHMGVEEFLHAPKTMIVAFAFSGMSWMLALSVFYFTFLAIGYPQVSWSAIIVTSSVFAAVKSIPIGVPFEVGLPEITLTTLFFAFGVPREISATATILARLLTLWLRFFIGLLAQQWLGIKAMMKAGGNTKGLVEMEKT